ncbi:hypothetical protein ER353_06050 [Campylobacter coli]|nr:hypothetical protein [Campylobacter coli]
MSSNIDILKYLLFVEYLTPQNIKKINNCCDTCETSYINQYIREKIEKICNALTLNNKNLDDYSVEIIIQGAIYNNKTLFENIINNVGGKIKCRKRKIKCRIFATNYLSFNLKLKL